MQESLQQGRQLHLQTINSKKQRFNSRFPGETSYYNIVGGVEYQKQDLIDILTDKQSASALENGRSTSHIVVIVGCGGTGKTTLAQKVLVDHHTRNAFGTILWVQGSKDFTDMELLSAIASAAGIKAGEARSRDKFEEMLASKLEGKRVLLVLDDVWSHQIYENYLQTCLPVYNGSRILMTAWDRSVAEHVKSAQTFHVKELPLTLCLSLLSRSSCMDTEELNTSFKEIGETLIEKCCSRVPLAIKLIGGVLRTKDPTWEEWQKVIGECEGWSTNDIPYGMKDIAGPILVAYNDLPSHLKQCFLYCLYLPEDIMISRFTITRLWTSEGLIEEQEGCSPEDTAEEYYNELLLRNLLQPKTGPAEMELCTLHDCVRSVLQLLTKDFWTGKCRSMSSISSQEKATLPCFRTVILHKNPSGDRVLDRLSKTVKYLRVLDLNGTGIRNIPGSMEPLLHLRFLNLSHTDITELPESIGSLRNLQFLILQYCYRLHSLPGGISKLQNLRTLDLEGTTPRLVLPGLAGLKQLTVLRGFIVNSNEATEKDTCRWPLEDLGSLISLRSLQIVKMERIQQYLRAQSAQLSMKSQLTQLELCGSARKVSPVAEEEDIRLNEVLSSLRPPQCLESLKIVGYNGQVFPNWILDLQNLKQLVIADCNFFENLPALGQLPQLKLLSLSSCSELREVGQKRTRAFPKLEQLHLEDMPSLHSWEGSKAGDLPVLVEFHLKRCPRLRSLPSCLDHCSLLKVMLIVSADSLEAIDSLPSLRELVVQDSRSLASISNLPALEVLTIVDCLRLQNVSGLKLLKHLRLVDRELTGLPGWLTGQGSVSEALTIVGREVMLGSLVPGGKDWPAISGIDKVYGNLPEGSPFFTYTKHTAILESFGDRRDLINLADATNGNIASSVVALQLKSWWPRVMVANFVRRTSQIRMPATKRRYLLGPLTIAIYLLLLLPQNRYVEPFSNRVLLVFVAYIGMLSSFLLMWLNNKR